MSSVVDRDQLERGFRRLSIDHRAVVVLHQSATFMFWTDGPAVGVYADPCTQSPLSPPAGPSAPELAAAVSAVPGTELVSGPTEVNVGGYPAEYVVIRIPEGIGCAANSFWRWYDAPDSGRYAGGSADHRLDRFRIGNPVEIALSNQHQWQLNG